MPQAALDRYRAKSGKTPSCELANAGRWEFHWNNLWEQGASSRPSSAWHVNGGNLPATKSCCVPACGWCS